MIIYHSIIQQKQRTSSMICHLGLIEPNYLKLYYLTIATFLKKAISTFLKKVIASCYQSFRFQLITIQLTSALSFGRQQHETKRIHNTAAVIATTTALMFLCMSENSVLLDVTLFFSSNEFSNLLTTSQNQLNSNKNH